MKIKCYLLVIKQLKLSAFIRVYLRLKMIYSGLMPASLMTAA